MKFKTKYIVLLSIISTALLITLATTYGYFVSTVKSNAQDSVVVSGSMSLEFDDGPQLSFRNVSPGDSTVKTFSVTNTGTVEATYTLYFSEVINMFATKGDIVYSLSSTNANVNISNVVFPSTASPIVENVKIGVGVTQNYELTINYLNREDIQNENMNKAILAKIEVNNYKNYGTNLPSDDSGITASQKVENVAALRSVSASAGDIVETKGYYEAGDDGGAYYTIENKASQTIDNGKYIELDNGKIAKLMHIRDSHNVKQFGAKGDGVSDEKDAIVNAIKCSQGMFVYFPKGTYMVSAQSKFYQYSDVNLIGEGEDTVIKATGDFINKKAVFRFENINTLSISNITFDGNIEENPNTDNIGTINAYSLIDIANGNNIAIDNCIFRSTAFDALRLLFDIDDITVSNSIFTNVIRGVAHNAGGTVSNTYIVGNEMSGVKASGSKGIDFGDGSLYRNLFIKINKISYYMDGINMNKDSANTFGIMNAHIIENTIKDCATGMYASKLMNGVISNNTIDFTNITEKWNGHGIHVKNSSMLEISNNNIRKTRFVAIFTDGDINTKVFGNNIVDCGRENANFYFVDIRGTCDNLEFYNNTLIREDTSLYEVLMVVHGDGGVRIYDNTLNNGKIWLWGDSSNVYVSNSGTIQNYGTNNTIVP